MKKMNVKNLNKIYNEIDRLEIESIEDIEGGGITKLDEHIISKYKELFDEIYQYCVKEKITDFFDFDMIEELEFDTFSVIDGYIEILDYACEYDEKYLKQRADVIKKVLKQFELEKEDEEQYKIELADSIYYTENKEKAKKMIEDILKENPECYFAYETQYKWEKNETDTDYEKLDQIITRAEEKGYRVAGIDTYEKLIRFYEEKGNEEKIEFYKQLFQDDWNDLKEVNMTQFDEDMFDGFDLFRDEDEIFDDDNILEKLGKMNEMINKQEEEKLKEAIKEVKKEVKDKVQKDKTFEQYLKEKTKEDLIVITTMYYKKYKEKERKEDVNNILKNRKEIFKASIEIMTTEQVEALKQLLKKGYKEIAIESTQELDQFSDVYFPTRMFGILFAKVQGKKIILHIPKENIEILKDILKDEEVIKVNTECNKTYDFIKGVINTYGVIDISKLGELYEKCFERNSEELPDKLLLYIVNNQDTGIYVDENNQEKGYIYHGMIEEKEAKKIIKKTAKLDYCEYDIEMYLKLSDLSKYIKQTNIYKKLKNKLQQKQMWSDDTEKIIDESIEHYLIKKMTDKQKAEQTIEIVRMSFDIVGPVFEKEGNFVKKCIIEIGEEFPNWNKKGRIG